MAIRLVLRLEEDGLMSAGLPCTSFVWMNKGTHQRSAATPLGDCSREYVRQANVLFEMQ